MQAEYFRRVDGQGHKVLHFCGFDENVLGTNFFSKRKHIDGAIVNVNQIKVRELGFDELADIFDQISHDKNLFEKRKVHLGKLFDAMILKLKSG